ncbi:hypothetical protein ANN_06148 [Periplaneta americana]|uniref:Reverse transcriptase domain-containing protein n=1 Tax=Periplaneta americana TaxID=6978 RepID=A0ABQ8TCR3_PERAM|nr:hypothetical protein ANN_06148 [Periplaneta americana]
MERVKWIDRIRNEAVLERVGEERMMLKLIKKREMNWFDHWLRRNCLLKDALEGMVNGSRVRDRPFGEEEGEEKEEEEEIVLHCTQCIQLFILGFSRTGHSCLKIHQQIMKYVIRKVQDNREDLELNGLHQLLAYADGVNMLGENPQTIRENTGILLEASKEIGLEVNPEKTKLRLFENKVLRKIFGAKRDEVAGEWRKLHNTELHELYSSHDIIRNIKSRRMTGHVARTGESKNAYRVLVGRPEGKRPLGRPRHRWEDNIKMDLREVGYDDRDWINLAQDRDQVRAYVRAAMNLRGATPESQICTARSVYKWKTGDVLEAGIEWTYSCVSANRPPNQRCKDDRRPNDRDIPRSNTPLWIRLLRKALRQAHKELQALVTLYSMSLSKSAENPE